MTFLKKILLVDREAGVTDLVRTALEQAGGYLIKEERDCRMALNAARWFQPDLILFDVLASAGEADSAAHDLQQDASLKDTPMVFLKADVASGGGGVISSGILSGYSFFADPVGIGEIASYVGELLKPCAQS